MTVLDHRYLTGSPATVYSSLRRKVGALSRHRGFHQKIGITGNPIQRWAAYRAIGWTDMEVIYMSNSARSVRSVERLLIASQQEGRCMSPGYGHNINPGGEGPLPAAGPYYVYVVNAPPFTRLRDNPFRRLR